MGKNEKSSDNFIRPEMPTRLPIFWEPKLRRWCIGEPTQGDIISTHGATAFIYAAIQRGWSVFSTNTPDIGIDYTIAKKFGAAMIQLKTATQRADDSRHHVTLKRFLEGPLGFVVYYFVGPNVFFIIPTAEFWEIPRFKALKERVFALGEYSDTMSLDTAREVMGDYEGEKGWARMEQLTTIEGILLAVRNFRNKHQE